uniref:Uncharacterized protein n=1 Tax=Anguilla anguilla TaxID=7936 RepID=A0A0E9S3I1_ANGAN
MFVPLIYKPAQANGVIKYRV